MPVCITCGTEVAPAANGNPSPCPNCSPTPAAETVAPRRVAPPPRAGGGGKVLLWLFLGGLGLLAVVVLLAETGAVSSEESETKWTASGKYESEFSTAGRMAPLRGVAFTPTVKVGGPQGSGHELAEAAAAAIHKAAAGGGAGGPGRTTLDITITRVTPDGVPWVPFHKTGSCTFAATYTMSANTPWSTFAARGEVTGNVEQTMTGLCSTGLFREKMGQAIANAVLSDIGKLVAKYA